METATSAPELNMNVLSMPKQERELGKHGWYTGGTHSFDPLLKNPVVRDWLDNYTSEATRKHKMYQFQKVLQASGFIIQLSC